VPETAKNFVGLATHSVSAGVLYGAQAVREEKKCNHFLVLLFSATGGGLAQSQGHCHC
jgi:hypothetical protein